VPIERKEQVKTGLILLVVTLACASHMPAQPAASPAVLTLSETVEMALRHYPTIRVSQEEINAATAGIQLARTAYLPRVDMLVQVNRATRNNVFGMLLPQAVIPSISGPVLGTDNLGTAWGSAAGTLVTWEPFDFGLREANVAAATAARARQEATLQRTQFDVSVAAVEAYLTLIAAQETLKAAQAGVDRADVLTRTIGALVNAQLRPGADASRVQAELAAARSQLIEAQQAVDLARANVSQFVGLDPTQITVSAPKLLQLPSDRPVAPLDTTIHPLAVEEKATIEQLEAQLRSIERSYFPHFALQGAAYARGTGARVNGMNLGGLNGLAPNHQNYVLGFTVTFPVFDFASIRAREAGQSALIRAESARYQQIAIDLKARWNAAVATLAAAQRLAANTPVQVSAARAANDQAAARYQSGLGNIDEVAEAQRLLTQAEIDDALARLGVWRALLGVAVAAGDLQPFLAEASQ
jgi:outer membrane protein